MAKFSLLIASLLVVSMLLAGCKNDNNSKASADKESKTAQIEGTWIPASAELSGAPFPEQILKTMKLVLTEKTYTVFVGSVSDIGAITLHPGGEPKSMDIHGTEGPNMGKTFLAIYELTGDTLKICYDLSEKSRPQGFGTAPNTKLFLVHYVKSKN